MLSQALFWYHTICKRTTKLWCFRKKRTPKNAVCLLVVIKYLNYPTEKEVRKFLKHAPLCVSEEHFLNDTYIKHNNSHCLYSLMAFPEVTIVLSKCIFLDTAGRAVKTVRQRFIYFFAKVNKRDPPSLFLFLSLASRHRKK